MAAVLSAATIVCAFGAPAHPYGTGIRVHAPYSSIHPGAVWLDTSGLPIRAHSAGLLAVNTTAVTGGGAGADSIGSEQAPAQASGSAGVDSGTRGSAGKDTGTSTGTVTGAGAGTGTTFFWYGADNYSTGDGANVWINVYESTDLRNWDYHGHAYTHPGTT